MVHCPPKRIVVAVDFGAASAGAVALAGQLASVFGSTLVAVHAETLEVPPYFTHDQVETLENELRTARRAAERELRQFVSRRTSARGEVRIVEQPAVEAILRAAADADLIVTGTHGRRGPNRWWLGSIAERIVRESPVPVLVVHGDLPVPAVAPGHGPIVLSADQIDASAAHAWADALAAAFGGVAITGPTVEGCVPGALSGASLVVVPVTGTPGSHRMGAATTGLARMCQRPFLFVPAIAR